MLAVDHPLNAGADRFSSQRAGMAGRVHLTQSIDSDQGVDLCGRHRRMAEQFLHHADVCAAVEQMRGERMPQGVRGEVLGDACLLYTSPSPRDS